MKSIAAPSQMVIRVAGVLLLLLGFAFWAGRALSLVNIHMLLGVILVLALWLLAAAALSTGQTRGAAGGAIVLGLVVLIFGMVQRTLLPGSAHVVVQVIHLLLGLGAIGLGEMMGAAVKKAV